MSAYIINVTNFAVSDTRMIPGSPASSSLYLLGVKSHILILTARESEATASALTTELQPLDNHQPLVILLYTSKVVLKASVTHVAATLAVMCDPTKPC